MTHFLNHWFDVFCHNDDQIPLNLGCVLDILTNQLELDGCPTLEGWFLHRYPTPTGTRAGWMSLFLGLAR